MDLTKEYWKQCILDYISCCTDFDEIDFSDEQLDKVVNNLLDDDQMWSAINESIDYFLARVK